MSKGSVRRPQQVDQKTFEEAWDSIFAPKCPNCKSTSIEEVTGWTINCEVNYKLCLDCGEQWDHG